MMLCNTYSTYYFLLTYNTTTVTYVIELKINKCVLYLNVFLPRTYGKYGTLLNDNKTKYCLNTVNLIDM